MLQARRASPAAPLAAGLGEQIREFNAAAVTDRRWTHEPAPRPVHQPLGDRSRPSYDDAVCWHLLLGGDAGVRAAAADARQRLARFTGLHMTPPQWLHVTVLRAGTAAW